MDARICCIGDNIVKNIRCERNLIRKNGGVIKHVQGKINFMDEKKRDVNFFRISLDPKCTDEMDKYTEELNEMKMQFVSAVNIMETKEEYLKRKLDDVIEMFVKCGYLYEIPYNYIDNVKYNIMFDPEIKYHKGTLGLLCGTITDIHLLTEGNPLPELDVDYVFTDKDFEN